jgi:hypothetical protein
MADQGPDSVVWQGPPPNSPPPYLTYPTLPYHGYVKGVINVVSLMIFWVVNSRYFGGNNYEKKFEKNVVS